MSPLDRRLLYRAVALYAALGAAWTACARWVVPPMLLEERHGPVLDFVKRLVHNVPAPFLTKDLLGCWREFSGAVLIALVLHLSIVLILRLHGLRGAEGRSAEDERRARRSRLVLSALSLAFLAVTVLYRARQDYYLYLQMWYEVRLGHDPWFNVPGINGIAPLNAYGPLFNFLAAVSWVNPLAPKLLFAYAFILFAISQTIGPSGSRPPGILRLIVLTALFWNPFPWVEIANRGHFDILVALLCLWAIRAWSRGRDVVAGLGLAMGVLLKYLPVVLVPFLAFDRGRPRTRFLLVAVLTIALGMELSCNLWGLSTLSPLTLAANRKSTALSIFRFLRGRYSPLPWFGVAGNYDYLSPIIIALALAIAWRWSWIRRPHVEASTLVAVMITVVFYQTGFPQYHMVSFVLGSSWAIRYWEQIRGRVLRVAGVAGYFGWLGAFDCYYSFAEEGLGHASWYMVEEFLGLPAFLFGCAFVASVVWTEEAARMPQDRAGAGGPENPGIGARTPAGTEG